MRAALLVALVALAASARVRRKRGQEGRSHAAAAAVPPGVDLGACDVSFCYPRDAGCGALPAVAEASCRPLLWQAAADGSGTTYEAFCRLANVAVGAAVLRIHRAAVLSCVRARARS
jgi:hypothetical protein